MARQSTRPKLVLTLEEVRLLEQLRQSRTAAWREVQRAQVLWLYYTGSNIATIMKTVKMTRKSVSKWIEKALTIGVSAGLKDTPHGSKPVLTENAKAWVVHLACSKPKQWGYAAEVWSRQALAQHVRRQAVTQGHPSLARASKATVQRILAAQPLQPHKVTYYMERRDPNFETKMRDVLLVYQEVELQNQRQLRSREFIALLKDLDAYYPPDCTLRLILDNHSAHISKETRAFLATRPNRFKYVHTPTHGSWLNIVETLFGKMTRTFLRHIRVQSWEELRDRILQGIAEINLAPVVHRWKKFDPLFV
jgi:transposase